MSAITVDEIYNQVKLLPPTEQKQLADRLLNDIAPEPPNTFHNEEELEQMLLAGLNSGPYIVATPEYWQQKKERLAERFGWGDSAE